jgi:hypothetical protein
MIIKRIGLLSCAKLAGVLYGLLGLVFGALMSLISLAGWLPAQNEAGRGIGAAVGAAAVIVFPIFYGIIGFLTTLLGAWLYNVAAGVLGGIEVDIQ